MQLSDDPSGAREVVSSDLDQKEIFDAVGQDEDEALLRDTYRQYVLSPSYSAITQANISLVCVPKFTQEIQRSLRRHPTSTAYGPNMHLEQT